MKLEKWTGSFLGKNKKNEQKNKTRKLFPPKNNLIRRTL